MNTVACVLRSGGVYAPEWVARLERAAAKHLAPDRFVCLSDVDVPCERIPLIHDWPGWWSKVELWREGLFDDGLVFFVDLDTLILDDCREVWEYDGRFAALKDFGKYPGFASGLMLWRAGEVNLYRRALADQQAGRHDGRLFRAGMRMDLWWNEYETPDAWQETWPGMTASFKLHGLKADPKGHRIICFHGLPKPEDVQGWVAEAWSR